MPCEQCSARHPRCKSASPITVAKYPSYIVKANTSPKRVVGDTRRAETPGLRPRTPGSPRKSEKQLSASYDKPEQSTHSDEPPCAVGRPDRRRLPFSPIRHPTVGPTTKRVTEHLRRQRVETARNRGTHPPSAPAKGRVSGAEATEPFGTEPPGHRHEEAREQELPGFVRYAQFVMRAVRGSEMYGPARPGLRDHRGGGDRLT